MDRSRADDGATLTLHSSWRGIITSYVGSLIVLGLGVLTLAVNGVTAVPVVITILGVLFVLGVAFDYPIASVFDADGVTRRATLRRHRIEWDDVRQLTRTRPGLSAFRKGAVVSGLTAVVGRRRYLLTDHAESAVEHDQLEALLDPHDLQTDRLRRPGEDRPPTWLYRRKHHRPDTS